jgi:hypothetical protein
MLTSKQYHKNYTETVIAQISQCQYYAQWCTIFIQQKKWYECLSILISNN